MKTSKLGKALGLLTALVLSTAGLTVMSAAPASADSANPTGAIVRLTSPVITDENSVNLQSTADGFVVPGWYGKGLTFHQKYAPVGSTINLSYHVTDRAGAPLAARSVALKVNKAWSGSSASMTSDEGSIPPTFEGFDSKVLHATTDAFGNANFTVTNTDSASGEDDPASLSTPPSGTKLYSQMLAYVNDERDESGDLIEFHFVNNMPTAPVTSASEATVRIVSPALNADNSVDHQADANQFVANTWYGSGLTFRKKYVVAGDTVNLIYNVTDNNGNAVTNTVVKLAANKGWSGSNAKISVGGVNATNAGDGVNGGNYTATTDAFGTAVFRIQNGDTPGEATPASLTAEPNNSNGLVYSQMLATVNSDAADHGDLIEFHYVSALTLPVDPCLADPTLPGCNPDPCVLTPSLPGCNPPAGPTAATLRLVGIDSTNSYDGTHYATEQNWAQYYNPGLKWLKFQAGLGALTYVQYVVLDQDGNPVVGKEVQLRVAKAYSNSNAHVSAGTGGAGTEATGQQIIISNTTDALGYVTFQVTGLDDSGAGVRVAPTAEAADTLFTQIAPLLVGLDEMQQGFDLLNINYVSDVIASSDATLSALTVNGSSVVGDGSAVVHVAAGTTSVAVVATTTDANAVAVVTGDTGLVAGDNTVTVAVTAQDGTTKASYTVKVVVDPVPAPAVKISISSSTGKVSVKFINAKGKTARIYISGSKSVTKKITSNSQTLTFSVKKGKKTVSASVAGKNFTKSVTVK